MARKTRRPRSRTGMFPNEFRRRSLVAVPTDLATKRQEDYERGTLNYIVSTRRLDGLWSYEVEFQGQVWKLPGRVVARMLAHMGSIITEQRRLQAQERLLKQATETVAEAQGQ